MTLQELLAKNERVRQARENAQLKPVTQNIPQTVNASDVEPEEELKPGEETPHVAKYVEEPAPNSSIEVIDVALQEQLKNESQVTNEQDVQVASQASVGHKPFNREYMVVEDIPTGE